MAAMSNEQDATVYDVAVVGYGPTGLVAASLIGQMGHSVVVLERWPALYGLPRLTHIDDETARIVQAAGDVSHALRDSSPTYYDWFNGKGDQLLSIRLPPTGRMGYPPSISMYQPDIEDAMDERIRTLPNIDVQQGRSVTDLAQGQGEVTLTTRRWDPTAKAPVGDPRQVRARYAIAADGSKSAVRQLLGIEREDFGFNERWLNIDTERRRPLGPQFEGAKQFCDPARGHMFMSIGQSRQRFEFALLDDENVDEMTQPEVGWALLKDTHGLGPDDVLFIRQLVYVFEARIANQWRAENVLLAGDAAHTMPPYLGQGACSGMRDAINIAWKLSLVLDGKAAPSLLDSYELERRPHTTALLQMSIGLGQIANMRDAAAAEQRDAALKSNPPPPPPSPPGLEEGVLSPGGDGVKQAHAGTLTPQGRIGLGDRQGLFDDVVGFGFVLFGRDDPATHLTPDQRTFLAELGCAVTHLGEIEDLDETYAAYLDELGAEAFIARPDFVLYGTAKDVGEIQRLVGELQRSLDWTGATSEARA